VNKLLIILLACFGCTLSAALPPYFHSQKEIVSILEDKRLHNAFGSAFPIVKIEKNKEGYLITTTRQQMQVDVKYIPMPKGLVGPGKFELNFQDPIDLPYEESLF